MHPRASLALERRNSPGNSIVRVGSFQFRAVFWLPKTPRNWKQAVAASPRAYSPPSPIKSFAAARYNGMPTTMLKGKVTASARPM